MMLSKKTCVLFITIKLLICLIVNEVTTHQAPLSLLREFIRMNVSEYVSHLHRGDNVSDDDPVYKTLWPLEEASAPDMDGVGVVSAMLSASCNDVCQPRLVAIELQKDNDPSVYKYPACVAVNQCSGCCGTDMFECTSLETNLVVVKVIKNRFDISLGGFVFMGMIDQSFHEDVACACQCKVRAEHCNEAHYYDEPNCRCVCTNAHMAATCPSNRKWDDLWCDCVCPYESECPEGDIFDHDTCRCEIDFGFPYEDIDEDDRFGDINPCLGLRCRAGFQMIPVEDGSCKCIMSEFWGVEAASIDRDEYVPTRRPRTNVTSTVAVSTTPIVTTAPTRRRRPRPTRPRPGLRRRPRN